MQALSLWGNWPLGTRPEAYNNSGSLLPASLLSSHVEELCVYFRQAHLMARQLRDWGRLRSLTLKSGAPGDAPDLCTLLQKLAGANQLRSITWVLPKEQEAETQPHGELSQARAQLQLHLSLQLLLE